MHTERHTPRSRPRAFRRLTALLALALGLVLPVVTPSPAQAADNWIGGSIKYSNNLNCLLLTQGIYQYEYGVGVYNAYWGTAGSTPKVGETTYMTTVAQRIGTYCDAPIVSPKFVLPAGVVFDKTQPINCYYKSPTGQPTKITHPAECPQWSRVAADGSYTSTQSNWYGGWPLPSDANWNSGALWEFQVPIKATTAQSNKPLRSEVKVVDGQDAPTLAATVNLTTGSAPATVPGTPTSVGATATSSTAARVTFSAPANNGGAAITNYGIECTSANGGVSRSATSAGSPATVSGLTAGKQYTCRVRAQNSAGWSAWSANSATFTTPAAPGPLSAPTNLVATGLDLTRIRVTFTPPASNGGSPISSYWVRCWQEGYIDHPIGATTATSSPAIVDDLLPGRRYSCDAVATNAAGQDSPPSQGSPVILLGQPGTPTGVSATATSPTAAKVTFSAPASNGGAAITAYGTQCTSTNGGTTRTATSATSPATVTGLTPSKQYRCQVRAQNNVDWSAWSANSANFSTPAEPGDPGDPGADTTAPNTTVVKAPVWAVTGPAIRFSSPDADTARYHCRVDSGAWTACTSPYRPAWKAGSHIVQVRAVDASGNIDPTPASTVWTAPLDDRQLRRTGKWAAGKGSAHYRGTVLTTRAKGASVSTKTTVRARGISLVAMKCKGCGVVDIYYGKTKLKRVSLNAAKTRQRQVINIRAWGALQSKKQIRVVVVSKNKLVAIDGIGVRTR